MLYWSYAQLEKEELFLRKRSTKGEIRSPFNYMNAHLFFLVVPQVLTFSLSSSFVFLPLVVSFILCRVVSTCSAATWGRGPGRTMPSLVVVLQWLMWLLGAAERHRIPRLPAA